MSIFDRIRRITKANVHRLLDQAEPPEQELQEQIEELTGTIQEGKAAAATYGATFRRMEKEADQFTRQQADLLAGAEAAVRTGDEASARKLLTEKVHVAERLGRLRPGLDEGRKTYDSLRASLARLQDNLRDARLKLAELRSRQRCAEARKVFHQQADAVGGLADGTGMFDRLEDQVLQTEAEADVAADIDSAGVDLEQRSRELQIEAELAAMKDRLNKD